MNRGRTFIYLLTTIVFALLLSTVSATTVVVLPTYTNTASGTLGTNMYDGLMYLLDADANYIFFTKGENDVLELYRFDVTTQTTKKVIVDTKEKIRPLGGIVANDGYVTVGFSYLSGQFKRYAGLKVYTYDLTPVTPSIYCVPYVNPELNGDTASDIMYVKCGSDVKPNDPDVGYVHVTSVRAYPVSVNGTVKYYVIVGATYVHPSAGQLINDSYFGITEVTDITSPFVVKLRWSAASYIPQLATVGIIAKDAEPKIMQMLFTRHYDTHIGFYTVLTRLYEITYNDPNDPLKTYTGYDFIPPFISFYEETNDSMNQFFSATVYKGKQLVLMRDSNGLINIYEEGGNIYIPLEAKLSEMNYFITRGTQPGSDIPKRIAMTTVRDILLISVPVIKDGTTYIALFAYTPVSGLVELRKLASNIDASMYGSEDTLHLLGPDAADTFTYKVFKLLWLIAEPPYIQEAPGTTSTMKLKTTLPAELKNVNAPDYISIQLPAIVTPPEADITLTIVATAPEDTYGIIRFTYSHVGVDGTEDTFETGIIYRTTQLNDPPTTPEFSRVYVDPDGVVHVEWLPSVDPDGDQIYYEINIYDETANTLIISDVTMDTTYTFVGSVGHTYTIDLVATDGNLYSNTSTYIFTYEWEASVSVLEPKDGVYVVATLPVRVKYTTNAPALLEVMVSTDASIWNTIASTNVSGSGTFETNVTLTEGTTFLMARLTTASYEKVSNMVTLTYSSAIPYVLSMIEPYDGSTYETKPGAEVSITFTASYVINEPGTKTLRIIVIDENGNTIPVASATTDLNSYTLTSSYALPKGNYTAYPIFEDTNGTTFYGSPVRFSVIEVNTPNNPPSIPIPYDIPNTTNTTITLFWHASTDPDGDPVTYIVEVATDEFFQNIVFRGETNSTNIEVNNLYGGYVYYWHVRACDPSGLCSKWSTYDAIAVIESTGVEIIEPADGSAYVADETNTAPITVKVSVASNTDKHFELNVYLNDTLIGYEEFNAPMDTTVNIPVALTPGEYNITAKLREIETNDIYLSTSHVTVYAYGQEQAPVITLIDPVDGYIDTVTDTRPKTTITARASFELVKTGVHTIAIEYKLRWALTWNTLVEQTVDTNNGYTYSLTQNVELGEGIYLFRAKVVDPDGITWYSETHTVYIQKQQTVPVPPETNQPGGGGGGGGAGGAPLLIPEKVTWEVPAGQVTNVIIEVNNVGTAPIKIKIRYEGNIADYIVSPPQDSPMVIPPGSYSIVFRVDPKDLKPGDTVTGKVILLPTGTSIEIPVEMKVVQPGAPEGIDLKGLIVPIMIVAGVIMLYLLIMGAI